MLIDCKSCQAVPAACEDCVVTVLLGPMGGQTPSEVELDAAEQSAFDALVEGGLLTSPWRDSSVVTVDLSPPLAQAAPGSAGGSRRWRSTG